MADGGLKESTLYLILWIVGIAAVLLIIGMQLRRILGG